MSVSHAVMRMDLAGMPAMMFRNSAHGGLNMVYVRSDGKYRVGRSAGRPPAGVGIDKTKRTLRAGTARTYGESMEISDLLTPGAVIPKLAASSKKQALQELSKMRSRLTGLNERTIFDTLLERERLGTTGVGNGIAIPHGKPAGLDRLYGVFARLDKPIDFDSVDEQPVDLIFLLLAPESAGADHLKALARISPAAAQSRDLRKAARVGFPRRPVRACWWTPPKATPPDRDLQARFEVNSVDVRRQQQEARGLRLGL